MRVIVATGNPGKLREFQRIFAPAGIETLAQKDLYPDLKVEETGGTFRENAFLKAQAVHRLSGCAAVADDSGLCVDALDGAPGVYSARYSEEGTDEANNKKLLEALERVPVDQRQARFVSAVALAQKGGRLIVVRGESPGVILTEPRGAGGFGYDPLFYDETYRQTYGEMDEETKNAISHRSRALLALREELMK